MKSKNGSITVEMSMLFPVIVIVISSIVFLIFYMNDIVSIRASAQEYGIISNSSNKSENDIYVEFYDSIKTETIIAKINKIEVTKNKEKTKIKTSISFDFLFFNLSRKDEITVNMLNVNNRDYVTQTKVILDIIRNIKNLK